MKALRSHAEIKAEAQERRAAKKPKRVKRYNAKRKGARFPGRRNPAYIAWLHDQPCVLTRNRTGQLNSTMKRIVRIVSAHNPSVGAGGFDRDALPLEDWLHERQHSMGIESFCKHYRLDWGAKALDHQARYRTETGNEL